eukprot:TRINITY_DN5162_c0_g1_i1.p1 TRINITY_DN5162_c0_g1~~TRINITY_DN5162_c0_g1_i1.p1  ORF type:complete len:106 (+),score=0.77 TRINITY_DN5162_c0_g1_i1:51-368(+)
MGALEPKPRKLRGLLESSRVASDACLQSLGCAFLFVVDKLLCRLVLRRLYRQGLRVGCMWPRLRVAIDAPCTETSSDEEFKGIVSLSVGIILHALCLCSVVGSQG